jgi:hypothetical protein
MKAVFKKIPDVIIDYDDREFHRGLAFGKNSECAWFNSVNVFRGLLFRPKGLISFQRIFVGKSTQNGST